MSWKPWAARGSLYGFGYAVFRLQVALLDFKAHHVDLYLHVMVPHDDGIAIPKNASSETSKAALLPVSATSQNPPYCSHSAVRPLCVALEGSWSSDMTYDIIARWTDVTMD